MSDLEHGIWWLHPLFALFTKVKVFSDSTLVPYAQNRISVTAIADDLGVSNLGLLLPLALQVGCHHLLVLLGAIRPNLVVQDLLEVLEELQVDLAGSVALLAW
jgi:hypothetical protein